MPYATTVIYSCKTFMESTGPGRMQPSAVSDGERFGLVRTRHPDLRFEASEQRHEPEKRIGPSVSMFDAA